MPNTETQTAPEEAARVMPTLPFTGQVPMLGVASLLCSAFEGGIGYWATIVKFDKPKELTHTIDKLSAIQYEHARGRKQHVYRYIDYPLNAGGAVYLVDAEEPDSKTLWKLDLPAILKGLSLFPTVAPRHFGDFMAENGDATTADVFVQLCLFGEVVYG